MTCVDVDTQFSLKGDYTTISGGFSINASSDQLTVSGYSLSSADIGKYVVIYGAGEFNDGGTVTSGGNELVTSITAVASNVATLADTATTTVTGADGGIGTDNAALLIDINGDAQVTDDTKYCFSADGHYFFLYFSGASGDGGFCVRFNGNKNIWLEGNGASLYFISSNPNSYAVPDPPFTKTTVRNLFNLGGCEKMSITNFNVYNVGQTQVMTDNGDEYGHFTSPPYNRRYNKYANTGMFLYLGQCEDTRIENNYVKECGGLYLHTRESQNFNKPGELAIGNTVDQWGFVGVLPAGPSQLVNNTFDNSDAPALSIAQSLQNNPTLGPSHAIYMSSPESDRIISNNVFKNTLGTCIQFNTSGGASDKGENILINSNSFNRCMVLMSAFGSVPYKMLVSGNTFNESGPIMVDNSDGDIEISNNTFNLLYTDNTGAIADGSNANISLTNFNSVFILGNDFKNVDNHPHTSNISNISFSLYANSGQVTIQGNNSDRSNFRFVDIPTISAYSSDTRVTIINNVIESTVRFLTAVLNTKYGDDQSQFNLINNSFYMPSTQGDPAVLDYLGFNYNGNSFINDSTFNWSLTYRVDDNSFISNCNGNSFQGSNCITILNATGSIQTRVNLIANQLLSRNGTVKLGQHSFRALDQNYYARGAAAIEV